MKKELSTLLTLTLCLSFSAFSQTHERTLDKENMRPGEQVEYCITHKKMNQLLSDPVRAKQFDKEQQEFNNALLLKKGDNSTTKATEYTIPVVFHVLHNGGPENISKEQILSALNILNRDFAMLNQDTLSIQPQFQNIRSKADIKFVLATKAPNGACFSGITRTQSVETFNGEDGGAQVSAIVSGNDVYNGTWPGNKYLNIFICKNIGGAAGYTFNPGGWSASSMGNGIWVLSTYVGDMGTSSLNTSRTLTHEVGHWLNLSHVWGGTNNPGVSCGNDAVADTPACIGSTSCSLNSNTCSSDNAYWGFDQVDNVENYMDYSYCSKMFTEGQVSRMRTALTISSTGRANVVSAANLAAVGATGAPTLCAAKFSAVRRVICAGESLQFVDESFNAANGWNWSFAGGSPATSTAQNPTITYNTPGTYAVQLEATDGSASNTATIAGYVTVLPAATGIPYYESFETFSNFTSPDWFVSNTGENPWAVTTTVGKTGTHSAKLENFDQTQHQVDELESRSIDLSGITSATNVTLSFRYAYRKRTSTSNDVLKLLASKDCGEVWDIRRTFTASTMSGSNLAATAWTPSPADWITAHVTNITSAYWNENFRFKFQFTAGGGNNLYIDDINIYSGDPSDNIVLGVNDLGSFQDINLYPNPADHEVQISFSSPIGNNPLKFAITDLAGKTIRTIPVNAHEGSNLVFIETTDLSAGTYLIKMISSSEEKTLTFVKK